MMRLAELRNGGEILVWELVRGFNFDFPIQRFVDQTKKTFSFV